MVVHLKGVHCYVRDTNRLRIVCSAITYCRDNISYRLLLFRGPLMNKVLLGAYEIWLAEELLPNEWPDVLLYQHVATLSHMQRAKTLAWSVLLGPKPSETVVGGL